MERKSEPETALVVDDPEEVARIEAENALRQFDFVVDEIERNLGTGDKFKLRPSTIQRMNRLAVEKLTNMPGSHRPGSMKISNSSHVPPPPDEVPELLEELCDYVNDNWSSTPWHLGAYCMWRLNRIHPFEDGNGRTSRALGYLVLSVRAGQKLPGKRTIPDVIASNKGPYYNALEAADRAWKEGSVDVSDLEAILKSSLAEQLASFHEEMTGDGISHPNDADAAPNNPSEKSPSQPARRDSWLGKLYVNNQAWFWVAGIVIAVVLAILTIL